MTASNTPDAPIETPVASRGSSDEADEVARLAVLVAHGHTAVRDYERAHGPIPAHELDAVDRAWPA